MKILEKISQELSNSINFFSGKFLLNKVSIIMTHLHMTAILKISFFLWMARVSLSLSFRSIDRSKHKLHIDHHTLMIFNLHLFCMCVSEVVLVSIFFFDQKKNIYRKKTIIIQQTEFVKFFSSSLLLLLSFHIWNKVYEFHSLHISFSISIFNRKIWSCFIPSIHHHHHHIIIIKTTPL